MLLLFWPYNRICLSRLALDLVLPWQIFVTVTVTVNFTIMPSEITVSKVLRLRLND